MELNVESDAGVDLDVVTVRKSGAQARNKVFIVFGEHSRELIGPESGIRLLEKLCDSANSKASSVLDTSEFQMVLNSNPRSRLKVEDGDFCLRENPSGVDLNRNWDDEWGSSLKARANTDPG